MSKTPRLMPDVYFFPIWMQNFEGQLKALHQDLVVKDDKLNIGVEIDCDFKEMDFMDFCLLVYQTRPDLINLRQN
mgnify:FL=1